MSLGPIQGVPAALSLRIKWPKREADHSRTSRAEGKNVWSFISIPLYASSRCDVYAKGQDFIVEE